MEKGLELPVEIIHHIQSFMDCREAAQTSVLSKLWYNAWSTQPALIFDDSDFSTSGFWDFANKTFQRYIDLNIKVDFILNVYVADASLVDKLIDDASKLHLNVLKLYIRKRDLYVLPAQVFAHKYMTELQVADCKIDHQISGRVLCSNLASLSLFDVAIGNDAFKDILAGCPLMEHLRLSGPLEGLTKINISKMHNLKTLIVKKNSVVESIIVEFDERSIGLVGYGRFLNLRRLVFKNVKIDHSFFTYFSTRFPFLEDLILKHWYGSLDIQISSHSLKRLMLEQWEKLVKIAKFDVPNISKFKFSSNRHIHPLSFTDASKGWKSEIKLYLSNDHNDYSVSWFSELKDLLIKLCRSKISLHVTVCIDKGVFPERNIESFPLPVVEELMFDLMPFRIEYNNFFLDCLSSCRPKLVSLTYHHSFMKVIPSLYSKLIEKKNHNGLNTSTRDSSLCIHYLKEVNVEIFEESLKEWKPFIKALSDDSVILNYGIAERLRFRLTWGSLTPDHTIVKFAPSETRSGTIHLVVSSDARIIVDFLCVFEQAKQMEP